MIKNQEKINRIAKNVAINYKNNKIAYSFSIRTENGVKNIVVNSIKIIIDITGLKQNDKKNASRKRKINNESNGPKYPLNDIKLILSNVPINIEFHPRQKAQPENIGISKEEAINIIKSLQPSEYKETSHKAGSQAADVYLAVRNILNDDIEIYIKFYIQNAKGIFVISFHESDK